MSGVKPRWAVTASDNTLFAARVVWILSTL